ncbi:DNA integrity scanning protein DisA [bioreactor metagenome]|uniref:DNA integrity scanning protein DisA n=2 Tax=root TaxID=1 RepID=A0A645A9J9_9ZZZZ
MQLNELIKSVEQDEIFLIRDYCESYMDYTEVYKQVQNMSSEDLLNLDIISKFLGYVGVPLVDTLISPRGYRMLNKIPRIPANVIENLVKNFQELKAVMEASYDQLDKVEGIGEARAKAIKNGLRRLREQIMIDRQIPYR